jgi:hypothetical protein
MILQREDMDRIARAGRKAAAPGVEGRLLALCGALMLALSAAAQAAAPILFHDVGHGLAFSADGKALFAPSQDGLAAFRDGAWSEVSAAVETFSGFSVTERAIYSSGRAVTRKPPAKPLGLAKSTDGGRTWRAIALAGEADFHFVAAGHRSGALYVFNEHPNSKMAAAGLYRSMDDGKTWVRAAARGLRDAVHGIAAHPRERSIVAVATGRGLFLSRDAGESFRLLEGRQPATAIAFDHDGRQVHYARALSNEIVAAELDSRKRRVMRLPLLGMDYVTCLAQSPTDPNAFAYGTRRRDVYLTVDRGKTWRRIADSREWGPDERYDP